MGIYFASIPSMQDYVNQNFAPSNDQLSSFVSSVMFAGEAGVFISPGFETSLELAYLLYSYTNGSSAGQYDLTFSNLMPTVFAYYVIAGEGYNFKFGGGLGPRFVTVDESFPATGLTDAHHCQQLNPGLLLPATQTLLPLLLFSACIHPQQYIFMPGVCH